MSTARREDARGGNSPQREALPNLARDLVQRKVVVLVAIGPAALRATKDATDTEPIVAIDLEVNYATNFDEVLRAATKARSQAPQSLVARADRIIE